MRFAKFLSCFSISGFDIYFSIRADVSDLLGDLSGVGVLHGDVRRFNVLSAAGDLVAKEECPRHGRVHSWRIIDFEYGRKFVVDPAYAPKHDIVWIQMQRDIGDSEFQSYDLNNN